MIIQSTGSSSDIRKQRGWAPRRAWCPMETARCRCSMTHMSAEQNCPGSARSSCVAVLSARSTRGSPSSHICSSHGASLARFTSANTARSHSLLTTPSLRARAPCSMLLLAASASHAPSVCAIRSASKPTDSPSSDETLRNVSGRLAASRPIMPRRPQQRKEGAETGDARRRASSWTNGGRVLDSAWSQLQRRSASTSVIPELSSARRFSALLVSCARGRRHSSASYHATSRHAWPLTAQRSICTMTATTSSSATSCWSCSIEDRFVIAISASARITSCSSPLPLAFSDGNSASVMTRVLRSISTTLEHRVRF
mmetsp:Transcript_39352/g.93089  ORF Transcript_39352/g.93089 Transcript_39352/m.93089 type:complete len:313 (+) Transcript_39352:276-1214(+)